MSVLKQKVFDQLGDCYYQAKLANGLQVYLLPKPAYKEAAAFLTVDFGSLDTRLTDVDKNFPAGIAHFLEHKVFEQPNGEDAAELFSELGLDSNAFTSFNRTCYYFSGLGNLSAGLRLLQDFVMQTEFSQESVDREVDIIKQEIAMYADDADSRLYQGLLENLYPDSPLALDIAGSFESVEEISLADLRYNHQTFYQPAKMTLLVVGDFDAESYFQEIVSHQEKYVTSPVASPSNRQVMLSPAKMGQVAYMDLARPKYALGLRHQGLQSCQSHLQEELSLKLYFGMLMGWLSQTYQTWYEQGWIDDSFSFELEINRDFQSLMIFLDSDHHEEVKEALLALLAKAQQSPDLTQAHFDLLKREIYGDFLRSLDEIEHLGMQFLTYLDQGETYYHVLSYLQDLTFEQVLERGAAFLAQAQKGDFTILPK